MFFLNTFIEFCEATGKTVEITVSVEAEGGSTCSVSSDREEYECGYGKNCPAYGKADCILVRIQ